MTKCCAGAVGATMRSSSVQPIATPPPRTPFTTVWGFGVPVSQESELLDFWRAGSEEGTPFIKEVWGL